MNELAKTILRVADVYGTAVAVAVIVKHRGSPPLEAQQKSIDAIGAAIDSLRGNRPKDTPVSWESLELALIGGLKMALEILET